MAKISTIILGILLVVGIVLIIIGGIYYPSGKETQTWPKTMAVAGFVTFVVSGVALVLLHAKDVVDKTVGPVIALKITPD